MTMTPPQRTLALSLHVVASVGWLGAVAAFLAVALAGLTRTDVQMARASCLAMQTLMWMVIVPLCFASLATGLVSSLGTRWGLFRHYWVVVKLGVTAISTVILMMHARIADLVASVALQPRFSPGDAFDARVQLAVDAALAIAALLCNTALATWKPRGMTRHGWRATAEAR
jgi:hypothetical protein